MGTVMSQITSLTIVYSIVYSDAHQIKHQSSASLVFVRGIHRDRWIPRTNGQIRGKCFHLMTSSCEIYSPPGHTSILILVRHQAITRPPLTYCIINLMHYSNVIMSAMVSQITGVSVVTSTGFFFMRSSKKTSKLRVTGLCEGNPPMARGFPSQRTSKVENVPTWWRHHGVKYKQYVIVRSRTLFLL